MGFAEEHKGLFIHPPCLEALPALEIAFFTFVDPAQFS